MTLDFNESDERPEHDEQYFALPPSDGADFNELLEPPRSTPLGDILDTFFSDLDQGVPPVRWPIGDGWGTLAFRPHQVVTIGGPANVGKTPLLLNLMWKAMEITPSLRVLVANNESPESELMESLTAMLATIDLSAIQDRDKNRYAPEQLAVARSALRKKTGQLEFMKMPFSLEQVMRRAEDFQADIVFIDTLQKLKMDGYDGEVGDRVGRMMPMLRELAFQGRCVVAAAQISRDGVRHLQTRIGSQTHDDRDLGVFLHSSEVESASNDAFVLGYERNARVIKHVGEEYTPIPMWLQHVKGRTRMKANIPLLFDGRYQLFTLRPVETVRAAGGRSRTSVPSAPKTKPVEPPEHKRAVARAKTQPAKTEGRGGDDANHEWIT